MAVVKFQVRAPAIGVNGDRVTPSPLRAAFERFADKIADFSPFFERLMRRFEGAAERQFDAQGKGPVAGKWAELTPKYREQKLRRWGAQPILVASGQMRREMTQPGAGLRVATATQMAYGTATTEYASHHQRGTAKMPARPPVDLDEEFNRGFAEDALNHTRSVWLASRLNEHSQFTATAADYALQAELDKTIGETE